jgi:hypothetical protein
MWISTLLWIHWTTGKLDWVACSFNYGTILPWSAKVGLADTSCCCIEWIMQIVLHTVFGCEVGILLICYKVTKRCRLSWLTNSAIVYEPKRGGRVELRGLSQWVQLYTGDQINFGDLTLCECTLIYISWFSGKWAIQYTGFGDGSGTPVKLFFQI